MQVALRIRPMNEDEIIQGAIPIAYKVGTSVSNLSCMQNTILRVQ